MTSLFHVSDLHFGYEDREALDWFAREVDRIRPAAVICTGDLTMRGRRGNLPGPRNGFKPCRCL